MAENLPAKTSPTQQESGQQKPKRLYRSVSNRMISGVCGGVADYLALDATLVRCLWVILTFFGGVGLLLYIIAWIVVPENPSSAINVPAQEKPKKTNSGLVWGFVLVIVGTFILFERFNLVDYYPFHYNWHLSPGWLFDFRFDLILPLLIIIFGAYYLMKSFREENKNKDTSSGGNKMEKKLTRSVSDKMIAGVCGGIAAHFNIDPSLVRIGFALLTLAGGGFIGILAYLVMMVVVPEETVVDTPSGSASVKVKKTPAKKSSAGTSKKK